VQALTVPQWIGARYESTTLRWVFAVLSLGLVTFATLIVVALAVVLGRTLALPPDQVAVGLLVIVVTGVMLGGATGHAWTNAVQAAIMAVVAVLLIGNGLPLLADGGVTARLAAIDPNLVGATNPASPFFRNLFEVAVCNFIIGLAIVCQPHIIAKALYLRDDRDVRSYLTTAIVVGLLFTAVLVTGIWARFALAQPVPIDRVIATWMAVSFAPAVQVLITIGLLCAGLSTLEGILLALSATFSADFYPLISGKGGDRTALLVGRVGLAGVAVVTAGLAVWQISHPTGGTVAIFAQYGVYLLFSAAFLPLACGMFLPRVKGGVVGASVVAVVVTYAVFSLFKVSAMHNNPAFLATAGILAGWAVVAVGALAGGLEPKDATA
jgi:Na+/proline symporter